MKSLTKLLELCVLLCSDSGHIWLPGPGGKNIGKEELLSAWDHRRLGIIPNRSLASLSHLLATNYQPLDFILASIDIWSNCHEWLLGTLDCETLLYCKQIVALNTVNLYCQQKSLKDIMQGFFSVWIRQTHIHLRTEEQTKGIELARQALSTTELKPQWQKLFSANKNRVVHKCRSEKDFPVAQNWLTNNLWKVKAVLKTSGYCRCKNCLKRPLVDYYLSNSDMCIPAFYSHVYFYSILHGKHRFRRNKWVPVYHKMLCLPLWLMNKGMG